LSHESAAAPAQESRAAGGGAPPRVLLVEDDPDIQEVLGTLLAEDGFRVAACATPHEGMALLREGDVQLMITDRRLAAGDGIELLRFLDEHNLGSVRTILLTAARPPVTPQEAPLVQALAVHVLAKPFDIDQLADLARELTGWRGRA
jgi:DNA-binding NtrC family response regulator